MPSDSVDSRERSGGGYVGVGASLRQSRVEAGQNIAQVAAALRIRRPHLEAIEDGRFEDLPGQVYAIGFIRSYADHLELDSDWVVDRFREETNPKESEADLHFPDPPARSWRPHLGVLAVAVTLAAIGYGGWRFLQDPGDPAEEIAVAAQDRPSVEAGAGSPTGFGEDDAGRTGSTADERPPDGDTPPAVDEAPPPDSVAPAPGVDEAGETLAAAGETLAAAGATEMPPIVAPEAAGAARPGGSPLDIDSRVLLRARSLSWVQVHGPDDETVMTRNLQPGDVYEVPNRPGFTLMTGNAGGIEIEVDGVPLPPLGDEGTVRRNVSLDPEALMETYSAATP